MSELEAIILRHARERREQAARECDELERAVGGASPSVPPPQQKTAPRRARRIGGAKAPTKGMLKAAGVTSMEMAAAAADLRRSGCK